MKVLLIYIPSTAEKVFIVAGNLVFCMGPTKTLTYIYCTYFTTLFINVFFSESLISTNVSPNICAFLESVI